MEWLSLSASIDGFLLSIGLIVAIGAQNLFVLRQGVAGRYVVTTAVTCVICDTFLIAIGVLGVGSLIANVSWLRTTAIILGLAFLLTYGSLALYRAIRHQPQKTRQPVGQHALKGVILSALAFSVLNPHAILDTTVLIGGVAALLPDFSARLSFALGACVASSVWFAGLAIGARLLRPLFAKFLTIRCLDGATAGFMYWIAGALAYSEWLVV